MVTIIKIDKTSKCWLFVQFWTNSKKLKNGLGYLGVSLFMVACILAFGKPHLCSLKIQENTRIGAKSRRISRDLKINKT